MAVVAAAAAGMVGGTGAGTASAAPVALTVNYTCLVPLQGDHQLTVRLNSDVPASVKVGQPLPTIKFTATLAFDDDTALWFFVPDLSYSIEGSTRVRFSLAAPEFSSSVPLYSDFTMTRAPFPPDGSNPVIPANGLLHPMTFRKPGTARISLDKDLEQFTLRFRDPNGNLLDILGDGKYALPFDAPCTLNPGQNTLLASFDILPA
ncbi:DUF6801 domain-containing protein [Actinomadura violacea]|uniref:DUF6801 domain-containing protein n=1 Tax=Actinomadura violacea TaxID=2819934 RepID=A0ABS3S2X7_9ACTN|nr:DUF6801 domain-containing protein [Actinomadura violacea]MBO2463322.1 hypothetical protein [Actinomadura violacea]